MIPQTKEEFWAEMERRKEKYLHEHFIFGVGPKDEYRSHGMMEHLLADAETREPISDEDRKKFCEMAKYAAGNENAVMLCNFSPLTMDNLTDEGKRCFQRDCPGRDIQSCLGMTVTLLEMFDRNADIKAIEAHIAVRDKAMAKLAKISLEVKEWPSHVRGGACALGGFCGN